MSHLATIAEADAEYARNVGYERQDVEWILSDRDVWYRNPFYTGTKNPHPEDDCAWDQDEEFVASVDTFVGPPAPLDPEDYWDDIPF